MAPSRKIPRIGPFARGDAPEAPVGAVVPPGEGELLEATPDLPQRYVVKEEEDGRYLACVEAPEVKVWLEPGLSVTASAARKAPEGTIFLDGAAQGEPFLDLERQVYNLDHHEGCIRRFTFSACEQAMVLVLRGLDLRERPWTVYANAPDLDTVIAIWVLLNAVHLGEENEAIRRQAMPLVRLEGLIDSQGLKMLDFSGFSKEHLEHTAARIDELRRVELEELGSGVDPLLGTIRLLETIDRMVYPDDFFEELLGVEELARSELTDNRIVVVCRSEAGIYEIENVLRRLFGKRLGLVVLQKDERTYTVRQVDSFLPVNLEAVYRRLNLVDPAVRNAGSANSWGGSGEIGGSPRSSGTDLDPAAIAEACRDAYRRQPLARRIATAALAAAAGLAPLAVARAVDLTAARAVAGPSAMTVPLRFAWIGLLLALPLLAWTSRDRRAALAGFRRPVGVDWLWVLPLVAAAAFFGGLWVAPAAGSGGFVLSAEQLLTWLLVPLLAEASFRGLVLGSMISSFEIQSPGGRWFLSWPTALSGVLYAGWTVSAGAQLSAAGAGEGVVPVVVAAVAALVAGLGLGVARERSASLAGPLLLHYAGVAAVVVTRLLSG